MYLVNAVAFDAEWETPYDESQIQDATFYAEDGSGQEVSMMYDTTYRYLTMEHAKGFCRAYKEGYDFVALLPEEGLSLSEWLEELDGETFHETIRQENDTMIETMLESSQRNVNGAAAIYRRDRSGTKRYAHGAWNAARV